MTTTTMPAPARWLTPSPAQLPTPAVVLHAWRSWSLKLFPQEPRLLTVADLAECECPHLCNRDHPNE